MGKPDNTGLLRVLRAARYSAQGLIQAWRFESSFRQEVLIAALLAPLALWLGRTPVERALLIASLLLVLLTELLNSAIEAAVDRHGEAFHVLSGRAKDLGSAAVFISLTIVVLLWGAIGYERFVAG